MALKHLHLDRHLAASPILPSQSAKFNYFFAMNEMVAFS
jgi:hypothetical protein